MAFLAEMEFRTLTKRIADALGVDAPVIADTDPGGAGGRAGPTRPRRSFPRST
jgi:DNA polymerase-1